MNPVTGLSLGRIGIGVAALVKPELVASRLTPGPQPSSQLMTQWFGSREMALGAATLLSSGRARTTLVLIGMAVDAADAATAYQGVQTKALPQQSGMASVAVAGGAVIGGLLGLRVKRKARKTLASV